MLSPAAKKTIMTEPPMRRLSPAGGFVDVPVHSFLAGKTSISVTTLHSSAVVPVLVDPNALIVDAVTPISGTPDGGTRVTIRGTGLGEACSVLFGNLFGTNATFAN